MRKIFTLLFSLLLLPLVAWGQQITIDLGQGDQTLSSGTYIISNYSGPNRIIIAEGAEVTITLDNVNIQNTTDNNSIPFNASKAKSVTLLLKGNNTLAAADKDKGGEAPAIYAPIDGSITIKDASDDSNVGSLSVTGSGNWPGIGIAHKDNGTNIIIESGNIIAQGGGCAAGIGASNGENGFKGTVIINGGTVTATGGEKGAGIGGGLKIFNANYTGGNIIINGGTVTATGGLYAAGIGGGSNGPGGNVTINGGTVTAIGDGTVTIIGSDTAAGIGGGYFGNNPRVDGTFSTGENGNAVIMASSISDISKQEEWDGIFFIGTGDDENKGKVYGDVTLEEDLTIESDQTLEIPEDATLTIPGDVTLTNNGTITNNGIIREEGTLEGNVSGDGTVQRQLTSEMITIEKDSYTYTGEAITPKVTIEGYTEDVDYTVTYSNNINVGTATITITPTENGGLYGDAVTKEFTIVTSEEPDTPVIPDYPEYYNIMVEECEGVTVETSTNVVREGQSMTFTIDIAEGYSAEDMTVKVKRSLFGYTEVIEPNDKGIYEIKNIYTDIYITVDGVEEEEEETPTGMEELEGAKVYAKEGSIYVQTPKQERVQIISISGAVLKNETQMGLQRYDLPRGIYIICIGEERFKVRN